MRTRKRRLREGSVELDHSLEAGRRASSFSDGRVCVPGIMKDGFWLLEAGVVVLYPHAHTQSPL